MTKDVSKQVRIGNDDVRVLKDLKKKKIGENDSQRFRLGLRALRYCADNNIPVPA